LFKSLTAESQVRQTLDSLTRLAAWVAEAPIAAIVATFPNRSDGLAVYGAIGGAIAAAWDHRAGDYSPREVFATGDARQLPFLARKNFVRLSPKLRAILRFPAPSGNFPFVIALGVADTKVREEASWPSPRMREIFYEIAAVVEAEIAVAADIASVNDDEPASPPSMAELSLKVTRSAEPALLLDDGLRLIRANASMTALLRVPHEAPDRCLSDFAVPGAEALARLARRSLAGDERVADIAFDLRFDESDPVNRSASISVDPLIARDRDGKYLLIRGRDISQSLATAARLERLIAPPGGSSDTAEFLCETLAPRTLVRTRRGMSYLTLRAWRGAIKAHQVKALRALQQAPPPALVEAIAADMREAVDVIFGRAAFGNVVPVPSGHSPPEQDLSSLVAENLALQLELPVVRALACEPRSGASDPLDSARRPPIRMAMNPGKPVLLVDYVATSGRHLEEAAALLRPTCGSVFTMAWIGGEAAD
jgi:PAS domain-containing protein